MFSSIRNRFLLIHGLMLFIPIVLMGSLFTVFVWEEIEERIQQQQLAVLSSIKTQGIDRHTRAMESALTALAGEKELWRMFEEQDVQERIREKWKLVQDIFPKRAWIYYGNYNNDIFVVPAWEKPTGYDLRKRPWYTAAANAGELTWVEPYEEYVVEDMVFTASIPVTDDEGSFAGVLAIDTFLQEFFEDMRTEALDESLELIVVTREGSVIPLTPDQDTMEKFEETDKWDEFFRIQGNSGYIQIDQKTYHAAFRELSPLPFYLVSLTPRKAILSEIIPLLTIIVVFTIIVLLVTGAGSILIARYVIQNIHYLNNYMYSITKGALTTRTCVSGQDEFLTLNTYMNTMVEALAQQIESHRHTNEELARRNQQLDQLVHIDGLTGITNQNYFFETFTCEWNRLQREKQFLSLLFIDIDFFKQYNDLYGHQSGDNALRRFGAILEEVTRRPADLAARYGGEEFVVLLPNTSHQGAKEIGKIIQQKLEAAAIEHAQSAVSPYLTCSIGIVSAVPDSSFSSDDFLTAADSAMYEAKRQGRNSIVVSNFPEEG
jgi:diguanylate cyclase (GGDEF)-like protein